MIAASQRERTVPASFNELNALASGITALSDKAEAIDAVLLRLRSCWAYFAAHAPTCPKSLAVLYETDPGLEKLPQAEQREIVYEKLTSGIFSEICSATEKLSDQARQLQSRPEYSAINDLLERSLKWLTSIDIEYLVELSSTLRQGNGIAVEIRTRAVILAPVEPEVPNRKTKEVSEETKQSIRMALLAAFADGASESDLSSQRAKLAAEYDITSIQVGSIGAYLKIFGDKILAEHGLSSHQTTGGSVLSPRELAFGARYLMLWTGEQDRSLALSEIARDFNLSPQTTQLILSEYAKRNKFTLDLSADDLELSNAVIQPVAKITVPQPSPIEEHPPIVTVNHANADGGVYADYDNPTKIKWRECWFDFVDKHYPMARRANARILCLPSIEPQREIDGYIRLGFDPRNIIAVERDRRIGDLFRERCAKLGAQAVIGDLLEVVPKLKERLDVVSLDFLGPLSEGTSRIFNQLPLSEDAVVLANVMGRREQRKIQDTLRYLSESRNAALGIEDQYILSNNLMQILGPALQDRATATKFQAAFEAAGITDLSVLEEMDPLELQTRILPVLREIPGLEPFSAALEKMTEHVNFKDTRELPELRETELAHFLVGTLGISRYDLLGYTPATDQALDITTGCCKRSWSDLDYMQRIEHLRGVSARIGGLLNSQLSDYEMNRKFDFPQYTAMNILYIGSTLIPKVLDAQIVRYESPVSFARTPYHTVHLQLQNPIELRRDVLPAYRFVEKIAVEMMQLSKLERAENNHFSVVMSTQQLNAARPVPAKHRISSQGSKMEADKWLSAWRESVPPRRIASIQAGVLFDGFQRMHEYLVKAGNSNKTADNATIVHL